MDKHSSLFVLNAMEAKKNFDIDTWGQSYKTFYGHNLRIFIMSLSVCPWQAFPAYVTHKH
jgi:hypothetical protein